jgi:uncharacterized protein YjaG (DUF416 family)
MDYDYDNPFDKKLEILKGQIPDNVRNAAVFVVDTLDLCMAAARSLFENRATPEHALEIYDRIVARMATSTPAKPHQRRSTKLNRRVAKEEEVSG